MCVRACVCVNIYNECIYTSLPLSSCAIFFFVRSRYLSTIAFGVEWIFLE